MNFLLFYFSFLIIKIKNYEFNDCTINIKSTAHYYSEILDNIIYPSEGTTKTKIYQNNILSKNEIDAKTAQSENSQFYETTITLSIKSGQILQFEFDFETNPERKIVLIEIKCPNCDFYFCKETDVQKKKNPKKEIANSEKYEINVKLGNYSYTNVFHSSNISFIFPEIFYFFPSQIFELNMALKDNNEK